MYVKVDCEGLLCTMLAFRLRSSCQHRGLEHATGGSLEDAIKAQLPVESTEYIADPLHDPRLLFDVSELDRLRLWRGTTGPCWLAFARPCHLLGRQKR